MMYTSRTYLSIKMNVSMVPIEPRAQRPTMKKELRLIDDCDHTCISLDLSLLWRKSKIITGI